MSNELNTTTGETPAQAAPGGTPAPASPAPAPFDFETWLARQSAEIKAGLDSHTAGLKSALEKERARTKKLDDDQRAADAKRREAEMTEAQKWQAKSAEHEKARIEAEMRVNTLLIRGAFDREATKAGCRPDRLDLAYKVVDLAGVEIGGDGTATGVDRAVKELTKTVPELFAVAAAPPDTDADKRGTGKVDPKAREQDIRKRFRIPA